jgi:hypothetical protein
MDFHWPARTANDVKLDLSQNTSNAQSAHRLFQDESIVSIERNLNLRRKCSHHLQYEPANALADIALARFIDGVNSYMESR